MAKLHRAGVMWGGVRPENFIVKSGDHYPVLLATNFSHAALLAKGSVLLFSGNLVGQRDVCQRPWAFVSVFSESQEMRVGVARCIRFAN